MKQLKILLAAALVMAFAGNASAQGSFSVVSEKLQFQVAQTSAGVDTVSLLGMTTSAVLTTTKDTTLWVSIANKKLSQPGFTASPIAQIAVNSTGTTDSVGVQIQWASGPDLTKISSVTQAYAVFTSGDTRKMVDLIVPTLAADIGTRYRVIVWANDTGGVAHTYSLNAVYRAVQ